MVTREQALTLSTFHEVSTSDPTKCRVWRRNGQPKTWAQSDRFRLPVKFGLRGYAYVDGSNIDKLYAREDCPACKGAKS